MLQIAASAAYTLHKLRGTTFNGLLACGSMVLAVLYVFLFSLYERKKKYKRRSTAAKNHIYGTA
jgi:hypothetical protein